MSGEQEHQAVQTWITEQVLLGAPSSMEGVVSQVWGTPPRPGDVEWGSQWDGGPALFRRG